MPNALCGIFQRALLYYAEATEQKDESVSTLTGTLVLLTPLWDPVMSQFHDRSAANGLPIDDPVLHRTLKSNLATLVRRIATSRTQILSMSKK